MHPFPYKVIYRGATERLLIAYSWVPFQGSKHLLSASVAVASIYLVCQFAVSGVHGN